ncbi:outer membrane beta-barrel protein [Psychroflexus halocasei]|uniref:Outer membrane protein beta-barrel domain-containing protein n=1 Tax=Psychroflexus halocasei TaxID=908615 RepID=A0A1H3ZIX1_9FLAO|nr:outer membrane beta-barrel protein [Psychroflexus halocasei]SEA23719.1 Outer membrane protein beta-barrel domain-containing protein [Psychroflexus halocasei]
MKKQLLSLLLFIIGLNSYAQITFEEGYFINNSGQKITCLIKNVDWKNTPTQIEYKLQENDEAQLKSIETLNEFGINGISKYIKAKVEIDRSSKNINRLSQNRNPIFSEENLFLKVLVEGQANLYEYNDGNLLRYFYSLKDSEIKQLIYKKYKTVNGDVSENNRYRQQLWSDLSCDGFDQQKLEYINYSKRDLVKQFTKFNDCVESDYINFNAKDKRDFFHLTIKPRLNISSLTFGNSLSDIDPIEFDDETGFGIGIDLEFVLPFNKNKWAITLEPAYQSFKSESSSPTDNIVGGERVAIVDYSSIEIPIGLRHYFYINKKSAIYLNAAYVMDFSMSSSVEFTRKDGSNLNTIEVKKGNNIAFGAGYQYNKKFSLEFRYQTNRDILDSYEYWSSDYSSMSFILGYQLF